MYNNPNLDIDYRLNKIIKNYEKHGSVVIGVDFDYTIFDLQTHKVYDDVVSILKRGSRKEIIYCVWTANDDRSLVDNVWKDNGLEYKHYNFSPIDTGLIKPHFNILLDDSAGLREALELFVKFLDYLDIKEIK